MAARKVERRAFLRDAATVAASVAFGCGSEESPEQAAPVPAVPAWETPKATAVAPTTKTLPKRKLGSTGIEVSLLGLGTWLGGVQSGTPEVAHAVITRALDEGVTYIDTAPSYAPAEERVGEALVGRRADIVLGSKTGLRTRDGARAELEQSLRLLRSDWIDVWQVHGIASESEIEQVFAPGGAMEAFVKAKEEKLVRFLGITGHARPDLLAKMFERFPFDTVLTAVNVADWLRRPTVDLLVPRALEKGIGIIGMKTFGGAEASVLRTVSAVDALSWVWSLPVSTTIVGASTPEHVSENAELARSFVPLAAARAEELSRGITADEAGPMQWFKEL